MPAIFALESLFDAVKLAIETTFAVTVDDAPVKRVLCDWGQTRPQVALNRGQIGRVVFVPGGPDGDVGELGGAKQWPQPANPLLNLNQIFCVYVAGHDPTVNAQGSGNDRKHDHVAFSVLHETIRQLWNVSHMPTAEVTSPVRIGKPRLLKPRAQNSLGREYLLLCEIEQPILDMFDDQILTEIVFPRMALDDSIGDHHETSITEPES